MVLCITKDKFVSCYYVTKCNWPKKKRNNVGLFLFGIMVLAQQNSNSYLSNNFSCVKAYSQLNRIIMIQKLISSFCSQEIIYF